MLLSMETKADAKDKVLAYGKHLLVTPTTQIKPLAKVPLDVHGTLLTVRLLLPTNQHVKQATTQCVLGTLVAALISILSLKELAKEILDVLGQELTATHSMALMNLLVQRDILDARGMAVFATGYMMKQALVLDNTTPLALEHSQSVLDLSQLETVQEPTELPAKELHLVGI